MYKVSMSVNVKAYCLLLWSQCYDAFFCFTRWRVLKHFILLIKPGRLGVLWQSVSAHAGVASCVCCKWKVSFKFWTYLECELQVCGVLMLLCVFLISSITTTVLYRFIWGHYLTEHFLLCCFVSDPPLGLRSASCVFEAVHCNRREGCDKKTHFVHFILFNFI